MRESHPEIQENEEKSVKNDLSVGKFTKTQRKSGKTGERSRKLGK